MASFEEDVKTITTRDMWIIAKAISYAVGTIDALPPDKQEASDRDDMLAILRFLLPTEADRSLEADEVERHTGVRPNLETYLLVDRPNYPRGKLRRVL